MRDWYAKVRNMGDVDKTLDMMQLYPNSEVSFPQFFDPTIGNNLLKIKERCAITGVKYVSNVLMRCIDGVLLFRKPNTDVREYLRRYKLRLEERSCQILEEINGDYDALQSVIGKPFWALQPDDWAFYMFRTNRSETSSELIPYFTYKYHNGLAIDFPTILEVSEELRYNAIYHVHPRDVSFLSNGNLHGIIFNENTPNQLISLAQRHNLETIEGSGTNHALA